MAEVIVGGQPRWRRSLEKAQCTSTLFFVVTAGDLKVRICHYQFFTPVG